MKLELFTGLEPSLTLPAGVGLLDVEKRTKLTAEAAVKHARHRDYAAVLAKLAVEGALRADDRRIGIISTGGPIATARSLAFTAEAVERGPRFVNPLGFPSTLPSDVPTGLAAELGAHQFAITVGWNRLAFWDALTTAQSYFALGLADVVLVVAAISSLGLEMVTANAQLPRPLLDVSVAARLGPPSGFGRLITIEPHKRNGTPDIRLEWSHQAVQGENSLLLAFEALAASFAVVLSEVATRGHSAVAHLSELRSTTCVEITPI